MSYQQIDTPQLFSPADMQPPTASPPTTTDTQQEHQQPPASASSALSWRQTVAAVEHLAFASHQSF